MDPCKEDDDDDVYSSKTQKQNIPLPPPVEAYYAAVDSALLGKEVVACSHGWLLLHHVYTNILSLCNSTTFGDYIILPQLHQLSQFKIDSCILLPNQSNGSSSNFKVFIFLENHKTVMCCRVAVDEKWLELGYWKQLKALLPDWVKEGARDNRSPLFLSRAVARGRKIYAALCAEWLCCYCDIWCVELVEEPIGLVVLSKLDACVCDFPWCPGREVYLLESCGELFLSYSYCNGILYIYKRRFDDGDWKVVTNLGDRAFFIGRSYCLSCPVSGDGRVYYFYGNGSLCCYYTHDESFLMHKFTPSSVFPIWIVPQFRNERMSYDKGGTITMDELRRRKLSSAIEVSQGNMNNHQLDNEGKRSETKLSDLPNDIVIDVIMRLLPKEWSLLHLFPFDYMNFRAVSRSFFISLSSNKVERVTRGIGC